MDIKRFYEEIGGNYEEALSRLMMDSLIEKFVLKFKESQKIDGLKSAIEAHDYEKTFFEIHTLKGVALNLAFKKLGDASVELTELIRGDLAKTANPDEVDKTYEKVEACYLVLISKINWLIS